MTGAAGTNRPIRTAVFRQVLAGLLAAAVTVLAPVATARAAAVSLEDAGRRVDLPAFPSFMASVGDERFLIGFVRDDTTTLSLIDRVADQPKEVARLRLDFPVADGQVDLAGETFVAIGNRDGQTRIASLDLVSGRDAVERTLPMALSHPLVAIDAAGTTQVADIGLGRIFVMDPSLFDGAGTAATVGRTLFFDSKSGIGSIDQSADGRFIFVGDHAGTRLSVLDATGRVLDTLWGPKESNPGAYVGPATVSFHDGSQGGSAAASLLMADYASETMRVVDFEPVLQVLSIPATTSIALPIKPGSVLEADPVGGVSKSPILLGASADAGVIAVGNTFSTTVVFFSRTGNVLERIGSATMVRPPAGIAVSRSGSDIVVSYLDEPFVTAIRLQRSEGSAQVGAKLDPGGNPEVREIQKILDELGYPIGVVDGYAGPRTMRSLDVLEEKTGRGVDLARPAEALETLRTLRRSE